VGVLCAILFAVATLAVVWGLDQRAQRLAGERDRRLRDAADREAAAVAAGAVVHADAVRAADAVALAEGKLDVFTWAAQEARKGRP
jgi:hypothetical protein